MLISESHKQQEKAHIHLGDEPIIKNEEECSAAVEEIMNHPEKKIAVDCEGVNLGRHGKLCLVQVATPHKVYLFGMHERDRYSC